jgi:hypothetical protein
MSQVYTFPVGWGSFDPSLRGEAGSVLLVVVDDYTSYGLFDELTFRGFPLIGSKPRGADSPAVPEGKWRMVNVMHSMASDRLYAKAGIAKPTFEQLPALYAITQGELIGHCVFNARFEDAVAFIKAHSDG